MLFEKFENCLVPRLLPTTGNTANYLSAHFGKKVPKREAQIQDLLNTLSDLGQL